jgi:subtilisin family serine protease
LNATQSFFKDFPLVSDASTDLNVEGVHMQGIKGLGVNVLVLDDGIEIAHEDLQANVNKSMTWNFATNSSDPTPTNPTNAHGTNVSGMIAAVQNGIGVMGIAPRVTLGGARYISLPTGVIANTVEAYGGASWSKNTDVFNASYGVDPTQPASYDQTSAANAALESFPNLRGGKGAVMIKAAGNAYNNGSNRTDNYNYDCPLFSYGGAGYRTVSCGNASFDTENLELPAIVAAAGNAKGFKSSYSSGGSVLWVTGLGGELKSLGNFGESSPYTAEDGFGPMIYSTDLMGCSMGYSQNGLSSNYPNGDPQFMIGASAIQVKNNPNCNYDQMNGTSAATPTITGVVALMLGANPNLGWRDIREILRKTARPINLNYGSQGYRNNRVNLTLSPSISDQIGENLVDSATSAMLDYGWQTNGAGNKYSTWYGFGLVDAKAAVAMAQSYVTYKSTQLIVPQWTQNAIASGSVLYGQVKNLGSFTVSSGDAVDSIQLAISVPDNRPPVINPQVCMGSVGIFLKSPNGTVSVLSTPYNMFYGNSGNASDNRNGGKISNESGFVLGSYAFYGEDPKGAWTVYAVSGTPLVASACGANPVLSVAYRIFEAK